MTKPLTAKQKHSMDIYLRANTLFCGITDRQHIVHCLERALISATDGFQKFDLFLPDCFIEKNDRNDFWLGLVMQLGSGKVERWHSLEYGPVRKRERYVYTWCLEPEGNEYKFYTKILKNGPYSELIWYLGARHTTSSADSKALAHCPTDSLLPLVGGSDDDCDTDEETINLYSSSIINIA